MPPATLVAVALISLPFATHRQEALRELRLVIFEPAVYYILVSSTFRSTPEVGRALAAVVLTATAVAAYAIYHWSVVGAGTIAAGTRRALAVYHSPNALALFLGRAIPIGAAFALYLWRPAAMAVVLMLGAVALTYSRGAVVGLLAALGFLTFAFNRRAAIIGLVTVLAAGVLALPFLPAERLGQAEPIAQRFYLWRAALAMALDHPFTGVGLDNFLYHYPAYMLPQAAFEPNISHAHNIFLDFWTRLGILGLAAFAWLQYHFWRTGAQLLKRPLPALERTFVIAIMASMLDFLVHGLLDNSYFLIDLAYLYWLSCALLVVLKRTTEPGAATFPAAS